MAIFIKLQTLKIIKSTLAEIQNIAKTQFGFSDWRCISMAICGNPSKKEMLKCLKEMVL